MELRFCNDFGADGFSWIVDERMTRTSHALASDGKVWLVDPVDWPDAIERARLLGKPTAVLQLLEATTVTARRLPLDWASRTSSSRSTSLAPHSSVFR